MMHPKHKLTIVLLLIALLGLGGSALIPAPHLLAKPNPCALQAANQLEDCQGEGQVGNTDDGQVGEKDDGQVGNKDDKDKADKNDGQQGQRGHQGSQQGENDD